MGNNNSSSKNRDDKKHILKSKKSINESLLPPPYKSSPSKFTENNLKQKYFNKDFNIIGKCGDSYQYALVDLINDCLTHSIGLDTIFSLLQKQRYTHIYLVLKSDYYPSAIYGGPLIESDSFYRNTDAYYYMYKSGFRFTFCAKHMLLASIFKDSQSNPEKYDVIECITNMLDFDGVSFERICKHNGCNVSILGLREVFKQVYNTGNIAYIQCVIKALSRAVVASAYNENKELCDTSIIRIIREELYIAAFKTHNIAHINLTCKSYNPFNRGVEVGGDNISDECAIKLLKIGFNSHKIIVLKAIICQIQKNKEYKLYVSHKLNVLMEHVRKAYPTMDNGNAMLVMLCKMGVVKWFYTYSKLTNNCELYFEYFKEICALTLDKHTLSEVLSFIDVDNYTPIYINSTHEKLIETCSLIWSLHSYSVEQKKEAIDLLLDVYLDSNQLMDIAPIALIIETLLNIGHEPFLAKYLSAEHKKYGSEREDPANICKLLIENKYYYLARKYYSDYFTIERLKHCNLNCQCCFKSFSLFELIILHYTDDGAAHYCCSKCINNIQMQCLVCKETLEDIDISPMDSEILYGQIKIGHIEMPSESQFDASDTILLNTNHVTNTSSYSTDVNIYNCPSPVCPPLVYEQSLYDDSPPKYSSSC